MGACKCLLGSILCVAVLAAGAICAWRFGPWYDDGGSGNSDTESAPPGGMSPEDLRAATACEGCCNGLASNCALPVNEVTFPMVHNAMSSRDDLFAGYNNLRSLEGALVAGYRGLMLDSCVCDGSLGEKIQNYFKGEDKGDKYLGFCHSSCDVGVRDPMKTLANIKTFLDVNRNEVLIIEFEINDDSLGELYYALDESGLDQYVYRPTKSSSSSSDVVWPTMQSLIDTDARLLLFAHGDGIQSCDVSPCPEGIFYTFDHFQQTDWAEIESCDVMGTPSRDDMGFFLMNHFLNNDADLPSQANAEEYNTYAKLYERFRRCEGRIPNVVAVDFWSVGDVLEFVQMVNNKAPQLR